MSYDNVLNTLGLTQTMAESILLYSAIAIIVGMILFVFWQYIVLGVIAFGVFTVVTHHPENNTVVKNSSPIIIEETIVEKDPNIHKTSFVDPILLLLKLKELSQLANTTEPEKVVKEEILTVVETEEMRDYVKNCTELTNNSTLCQESWNAVAEVGGEILLDPVERRVRKQNTQPKVEKVSVPKSQPKVERVTIPKAQSKVTEVKLLDVDNKEYKERRAAALSKPNAIVFQETYR